MLFIAELSKLMVLIVLLYTYGHAFILIGLTLYLPKEVVKHRLSVCHRLKSYLYLLCVFS